MAGALSADNRHVGANFGTSTALATLGFVDVGNVVAVKRDCAKLAHVFATVHKATTASIGNFETTNRTLVAGNFDNLDHVWIGFVATQGQLYALTKDCALLVDTATHGCFFAGDNHRGDIQDVIQQLVVPSKTSHFA